ncbi:hypothetical protein [Baekduia sp. Peel2402]|uniref:hypothetical protein n=1 Tax=Baekduia sp. Peel2402 TaxID=3458296 RepID=UPI00403ECE9C
MRRLLSCAVLLIALLVPASAPALELTPDLSLPASKTVPPPGFSTSAQQVFEITKRQPEVRRLLAEHPEAQIQPSIHSGALWDVQVVGEGDRPLADLDIARDGRVLHVWTGIAAGSYMARGHHLPSFERPWVWLTFAVLFLVPFVDVRRLRRMLHVDLLVLLGGFGLSYAVFTNGHPDAGTLLFYPPLLYVLGRMLWVGLRRPPRAPRGRLVPHLPTAVLLVGVVALFGGRVALNLQTERIMDIGYASVIGADRVVHKQQLYQDNENHGDTYGPLNYISYVPFELALPWRADDGATDVPAAHAATLFFDLLTIVGLFLLGLKLRAGPEGRRLGLAMAWAWAACPITLLAVMDSTNDMLVSAMLVFALVAFRSAPARGALIGAAAATKFMPGALLLLIARGRGDEGRKATLTALATGIGIFLFAMAVYFPDGGLRELWNCTLGYQMDRVPDISIWAVNPDLDLLRKALEGAGLLLALAISVLPGRRSIGQIAALAAAITIVFQLPAGHWFYFYVLWFLPFTLVALFLPYRDTAAAEDAGDGDAEGDVVELGGVGLGRRLAA